MIHFSLTSGTKFAQWIFFLPLLCLSLLQDTFRSMVTTCAVAWQLQPGAHFELGAVPSQGCGLGIQTIIFLAQDEQPE